jgi:cysteine desulfurase
MGTMARWMTKAAIEKIAQIVGCAADEITITSGATESNNIVVLGAPKGMRDENIVICPIDHKSTLEAAEEIARRGVKIRRMKILRDGRIDLEHLKSLIDTNTTLVSLAYVNSEIGVIQDIDGIGKILTGKTALLHLDATQAVGKLALNVGNSRADAVSFSAHKIGGPKGIGALYVRKSKLREIRPITFGGGQSQLRSGTLPTQLIVGFGAAASELITCDLTERWESGLSRRALLLELLQTNNIKFQLNSPECYAVPTIINFSILGVRSETVIKGLRKVCLSSGSACNADQIAPSYVLRGIGLSEQRANTALRVSFEPDMPSDEFYEGARLLSEKLVQLQKLVAWETGHV